MWGIEHPSAIFRSLINSDKVKTHVYVLMRKETFDSIEDKPNLNKYVENNNLQMKNVTIPNPNNPAKNMEAILYTATI